MKILFLHPNFPGQFKHIAKDAAEQGHEVKFLCQTHYGRRLPGVDRVCMKGALGHEARKSKQLDLNDDSKELSLQYRQGFIHLMSQGWEPDIVVSHTAWGCGVFIKEIWPDCYFIGYLEWWFAAESNFFLYDEKNQDLNLSKNKTQKYWLRNECISMELITSDVIISPTHWQKLQLPKGIRPKCRVIFDGIDTDAIKFNPQSWSIDNPIVTYGTRGMEPMRGFPQFIKSIPAILNIHPKLKIQIAGEDTVSYGGRPPIEGSWKKWAIKYLEDQKCLDRVEWMGYLKGDEYIDWLSASWCHIYLTHPFVTSWSFVEAIFLGCPLVASNVRPVREIILNTNNYALVDHREANSIYLAVKHFIRKPILRNQHASSPAKLEHMTLKTCLEAWRLVLSGDLSTNT